MKRSFLAIAWVAVIAACTVPGRVAVLDSEPAASEQQVAERRAQLSRQQGMAPGSAERFDIVVVGGSCAPKPPAKFAVTSCVNDRPCNGHGLRSADGSVACACYEVRGGCEADTFCHLRSRSCSKLPDATYHAQ